MTIIMITYILSIALLASPVHEVSEKIDRVRAAITEEGVSTYYVFKLEEENKTQYALSVITSNPSISYVPLVSRISCSTFTQFDDLLKYLEKCSRDNFGKKEALSFVQFGKACISACDKSIDKYAIQDLSLDEMLSIKIKFPEFRELSQVNLK